MKYQMYEKCYQFSTFLAFYQDSITHNIKDYTEYDIFVARVHERPIAVVILNKLPTQYIPLIRLKQPFKYNSVIASQLDKVFKLDTFFQIYVDGDFRNQGIASMMTKYVETVYLQTVSTTIHNNEIPLIVATGLAYDLVKKNMKFCSTLRDIPPYTNLNLDIHSLTSVFLNEIHDNTRSEFLTDSLKTYQTLTLTKNNNKIK
jgi:hypothetical protein